ncbi:MAG: preprotein translocase subunit SecA, partial [Candidatus Pacebacteria bacterium]|nr:preprotein translocase subunit SecA [Candidatus Paceibacterota bacterium]
YAKLTEEINANIELPETETHQPIQLIERGIILRSIDTLWVEHLTAMDKLRTGIGLQGYGQRDPLVEYKREAYILFNSLLDSIRKQIVYSIFKVGISRRMAAVPGESNKKFAEQKSGYSPFQKQVEDRKQTGQVIESKPRDEAGKKVGRNDPCPCGSGKKYKKCHGLES